MAGRELAGPGWEGWRFHSGKLWTPEGHRIEPQDGSWWSLLVRQARGFRAAYAQLHELRCELARAWKAGYLEPDWEAVPSRAGADAAPGRAAGSGLVPSINKWDTADISPQQSQSNQELAEISPMSHDRYQIDHEITSCPTLSDSPLSSTPRPANGVSDWASASMPSSPLPLTPTFGPGTDLTAGGRRLRVGSQSPVSGPPARKRRPQHLSDSGEPSKSMQTRPTGATGTTPKCGPALILSSHTDGKGSIKRMTRRASPSSSNTGALGNGQSDLAGVAS